MRITDLFAGKEFSLSQMDNYFASSDKKDLPYTEETRIMKPSFPVVFKELLYY